MRAYGQQPGGAWKDRLIVLLMLAFGAGAIWLTLRIAEQQRLRQARVLLDGDAPVDEVMSTVGADWRDVNADRAGAAVDVRAHLSGKPYTIVVYASGHCAPSRQMIACLKRLACLRPDCAVRHVAVDRAGVEAIDYQSPAAAQVPTKSFPYLAVYAPDGKPVAEAQAAKKLVGDWYRETYQRPEGPGERELLERYERR